MGETIKVKLKTVFLYTVSSSLLVLFGLAGTLYYFFENYKPTAALIFSFILFFGFILTLVSIFKLKGKIVG